VDTIELVRRLATSVGVSGFEDPVKMLLEETVSALGYSTMTDNLGSLIARKPGDGPRVMLVAHMDEIGMVVRYVDDKGYIYVTSVGGVNPRTLPGARLMVWSDSGPLEAVVAEKPVHLMREDERKEAPTIEKITLDPGLDPEEVKRKVKVGDPVSFKPNFTVLSPSRVASKSLDDRLGCAALLLAAQALRSCEPSIDLYIVFSVREEMGLEGARTAAYKISPEIAIAVDVTHAGDYPMMEEKQAPARLGQGPVISRGAPLDKGLTTMLIKTAEEAGIKYQLEAEGGRTGTDIDIVRLNKDGVKSALVSIPLRYMHTPSEIGDVNDVEAAAKLLTLLVEKLGRTA